MDIDIKDIENLPFDPRNLLLGNFSYQELTMLNEKLINLLTMTFWKDKLRAFGYVLPEDFPSWVDNYRNCSVMKFMGQFFLEDRLICSYRNYDYNSVIFSIKESIKLMSEEMKSIMTEPFERFIQDTFLAKQINERYTDIADNLSMQKKLIFQRRDNNGKLQLKIRCKSDPIRETVSWEVFKFWLIENADENVKMLDAKAYQLKDQDTIYLKGRRHVKGNQKYLISKNPEFILVPLIE